MTKDNAIKLFCDCCNNTTNHVILFNYASKANRLNNHFEYEQKILDSNKPDHFQVVECMGCDHVSFVHEELTIFPEDKTEDYNIIQYPDVDEKEFGGQYNFLDNEAIEELPAMIQDLYFEVEISFIKECSILAGIGLRTLVEATCIHQKIEGADLHKKIKNLNTSGLISNSELPILDKLRLIGNVSAHQIKNIPLEQLSFALDIINHVLRSIYVLPKINKKIKL